jgi:hypothetical protein
MLGDTSASCIDDETLHAWLLMSSKNDQWEAARTNPLHPWRQELQWWIVEQQIARDCKKQEEKGLRVPSWFLNRKLQFYWTTLPRSDSTRDRLRRVAANGPAAKNWRRSFRRRWAMRYARGRSRRLESRAGARRKTVIYLRWMRWIREYYRGNYLIINMDETSLSSIRDYSLGNVAADSRRTEQTHLWQGAATPAPLKLSKTTLLASICNRADIQPHLPQIRLPRCIVGKPARREDRAALAAAPAPLEIWHGTRGSVTMSVLMKYMLRLKHRMHKIGCTLPTVLLLDACPVHLSEQTLAFAASQSIQLAFIPARMTWLLQPLDTHVFAGLKRSIRRLHADQCIASPNGAVSRGCTIRQQHRAISEELSDKSWSRSMERVGATGCVDNLRQDVASLIAGENLAARYPSTDDPAALLNVPTARARRIRASLRRGRGRAEARQPDDDSAAIAEGACAAARTPRQRERSIPGRSVWICRGPCEARRNLSSCQTSVSRQPCRCRGPRGGAWIAPVNPLATGRSRTRSPLSDAERRQ